MQAGTQQVAAGYVLYGPSTMMALTVGNGVAFFTLDPETQTFLLLQRMFKYQQILKNLLLMHLTNAIGNNQ